MPMEASANTRLNRSHGVGAYRRAQQSALTPRGAEGMAFSKAAALLGEAGRRVDDYGAYASALRFNQMLWTVIQADVARPDSGLADGLKRDVLSLSVFVDRRTMTALAEPKAEHLAALIRINKNIAEGLLSRNGGSAPPG